MIDFLDKTIRELLLNEVKVLEDEKQIRFQPPDDDWRSYVSGLSHDGEPVPGLNVYLLQLQENRELRSNARTYGQNNGQVTREQAPARLDCNYLISAWSPTQPSDQVDPTPDEHDLLYDVAAVLFNNLPLIPSEIWVSPPTMIAPLTRELLWDAELPTRVLPPEGFPKLAEFWSSMGSPQAWKPVIYMVVTIPVARDMRLAGFMVTTRVAEYRHSERPQMTETRIQIGGQVLDPTQEPSGVSTAWVQLETRSGELLRRTVVDGDGRFTFAGLHADQYQLRYGAPGRQQQVRPIDVPSPTGEYDLSF